MMDLQKQTQGTITSTYPDSMMREEQLAVHSTQLMTVLMVSVPCILFGAK